MDATENTSITIETVVQKPIDIVWKSWTDPKHITNWNFASSEWHCPSAENELKNGGRFSWRMEAKDGTMGFDYCGTYDSISPHKKIVATLDDGRKVTIEFYNQNGKTELKETFEVEDTNTLDQQRAGWQAILDNFKNYTESQ